MLLNLGQGVAFDGWIGRGTRTNHPEDYPEYVKGCDIASFDIYPVVHRSLAVAGKITFVARGVDRLRRWTEDRKHVWNCIECTRISNVKVKPTPEQVRAEVWLSIIHGSRGITYFVHRFKPRFDERALLNDAKMLAAVSALNASVHRLAKVINSSHVAGAEAGDPVHVTARRHAQTTYVFAVNTSSKAASTRIKIEGSRGRMRVQVLDEKRVLEFRDGVIKDSFSPWAVHIYRLR